MSPFKILRSLLPLWAVVFAWALPPSQQLEKARYLYELQGDSESAKAILRELTAEDLGSITVRAHLELGKLSELSQAQDSAVFHYGKIIESETADLELKRWTAERLRDLSSSPTSKINYILKYPIPFTKVLSDRTGILLNESGLAVQIDSFSVRPLPSSPLNMNVEILHLRGLFLFMYDKDKNSIVIRTLMKTPSNWEIPLESEFKAFIPSEGSEYMVYTRNKITRMNLDKVIWQRDNPTPECEPGDRLPFSREIILQCPENTLRIQDLGNGDFRQTIKIDEEIRRVQAVPEGQLVQNPDKISFYPPGSQGEARWTKTIPHLKSMQGTNGRVYLHTHSGMVTAMSISDGNILWSIEGGLGKLYDIGNNFGIFTPEGNFLYYDQNGQHLWTYQSSGQLAAAPFLYKRNLILPMLDGRLIFLNRYYMGIQRSNIEQLVLDARRNASRNNWPAMLSHNNEILKSEPGNSSAWENMAAWYASREETDSTSLALYRALLNGKNTPLSAPNLEKYYANSLGAEWVSILKFNTAFYPELFHSPQGIFFINPELGRLQGLSYETGAKIWNANIGNSDPVPLTLYRYPWFLLSSGNEVRLFNIQDKGNLRGFASLPGRPYRMIPMEDQILLSTWNGFILALDPDNLRTLWAYRHFQNPASIVYSNGNLWCSAENRLVKLDPQTGETIQENPVNIAQLTDMNMFKEGLLFFTATGQVEFWDNNATRRNWQFRGPAQIFNHLIYGNFLILGNADQSVYALDLNTGALIWKYQGRNSLLVKPQIFQDKLYLDQGAEIVILDPITGDSLGNYKTPNPLGPVSVSPQGVFSTSRTGFLYSFPLP